MTRQTRDLRIRLAFEPNRFSSEQLESVYQQLKPIDMRTTAVSLYTKRVATKPRVIKRGEQ